MGVHWSFRSKFRENPNTPSRLCRPQGETVYTHWNTLALYQTRPDLDQTCQQDHQQLDTGDSGKQETEGEPCWS